MSGEAGKHTHEVSRPLSTGQVIDINPRVDVQMNEPGQEQSSSELIHNQGDQPLLPTSSSMENEPTTLQPQMCSVFENDTAAAQERLPPLILCPSNQGGDMSLKPNQDRIFVEQENTEGQLHSAPTQTLFGFDLSLRPSLMADTSMRGDVDVQLPTDEQQQQLSSNFTGLHDTPFHLSLDSRHRFSDQPQQNSVSFGNNGVVIPQFNATPSRPQEVPLFAQTMPPTEFYAAGGAPSSLFQLLTNEAPQHLQMQMTWPETIQPSHDPQQSQWSSVHDLQLPSHRMPNPINSLYDSIYESMGLPADPFLRMLLLNPYFANRRRRQ